MDIRTAHASLSWYKQIRREVREILARVELADARHFSAILDEASDEVWDEISERYDIHISFVPMSGKLHALCPFFEESFDSGRGFFIWINESLLNIRDDDLKWAMIRSAGFHELAHILSKGPFRVDDASVSAARTALDGYARDPAINRLLEARTELLAAEIAFAPEKKFLSTFYGTNGDFRALMKQYHMPLDCCVKWALITDAQAPAHYVKYNVAERKIEDLHQPKEHPYNVFAFSLDPALFEKGKDTIAAKALEAHRDLEGLTSGTDSSQRFFCKAYYLESDFVLGNKEKIVIVGFPQDGYDRICTIGTMCREKQERCTSDGTPVSTE